MPVRPFSRNQTWLFPPTLDELVPQDHPGRFVGAFVDALDIAAWLELGIGLDGEPLGAPAYHPRALLSVWLYGFMTGTRSSRKLEGACRDQVPYLWLTGWQHPDHNTLWRFYKEHRGSMRHLFKRTVRTAVRMGLVDMAVQAVDGTKVQANAAKDRTYDGKGLERLLERTEAAIEELEEENEAANEAPPPHLPEALAKAERLRDEVKAAMERLAEEEGRKRINLTDGDAELMKTRQGTVPGYNLEAVVSPIKVEEAGEAGEGAKAEGKGLIITAVEATRDPADCGQLIPMLDEAEEVVGSQADVSLADAGYHSGANLEACDLRSQVVVMPEAQDKALRWPYHKDHFTYDAGNDSHLCPLGQWLRFTGVKRQRQMLMRYYRASGAVCRRCEAFGVCTKNGRHGRGLQVDPHEPFLRRHRAWMATEAAQALYRRRKELPEPVFGILKEQMGVRRFLLRGWEKVQAEAKLLGAAFNLRTLYRVWRGWPPEKRQMLTGQIPTPTVAGVTANEKLVGMPLLRPGPSCTQWAKLLPQHRGWRLLQCYAQFA